MSATKVTSNVERILGKMGFKSFSVREANKDRAVISVDAKFPQLRKALSRQYGHADHNTPIGKGRRCTWILEGKGSIVATGAPQGPVKLTFATMPAIKV